MSLRQSNDLLLAAGFAPIWSDTPFDAETLAPIRQALDFMLKQQEPYPAVVVDRRWNLLQANKGAVIVRRAFSYNNGTTPFTERWPPWRQALEYDAGLLFLAYQQDPRTGFVPINTTLAEQDAMNQFTTHTASAVFAVPPGATGPGDWIGRPLLS